MHDKTINHENLENLDIPTICWCHFKGIIGSFAVAYFRMRSNRALCHYPNMSLIFDTDCKLKSVADILMPRYLPHLKADFLNRVARIIFTELSFEDENK